MTIRRTLLACAVTGFATVATGVAVAPAASAKGTEVRAEGQCTMATSWKLKAKTDNGRIEIEYEVDSNRVGQRWQVRLTDNGRLVHAGRHVTRAPSGSFEVNRLAPNLPGADVVRARAVNPASGEVCTGTVTLRA